MKIYDEFATPTRKQRKKMLQWSGVIGQIDGMVCTVSENATWWELMIWRVKCNWWYLTDKEYRKMVKEEEQCG